MIQDKWIKMIVWPLFIVTVISLLWTIYLGLQKFCGGIVPADVITEWLINYQGGFVRRGLIGEILLHICNSLDIPVVWFVVGLYFLGVLTLVGILIRVSKKIPGLLYLLPYPIFLYVFAGFRLIITRRDAWLLILAFSVFGLLQEYLKEQKLTQLIGINVLLCFGILIHEASVFYTFSLVLVTSFVMFCKANHDLMRSVTKMLLLWWPVIVVLLLVSVYHGDARSAKLIADSWKPFLDDVTLSGTSAYDFMEWNVTDAIRETSKSWFTISWGIPVALFNLYVIAGTYYLVTHASVFYSFLHYQKNCRNESELYVKIGAVMIVQGICLTPLALLFMSDLSRVLAYWTISSVMASYLLQDVRWIPSFALRLSAIIYQKIDRIKLLSSPLTYFLVLITLPVGFHHGELLGVFPCLTLELKSYIWSLLIS